MTGSTPYFIKTSCIVIYALRTTSILLSMINESVASSDLRPHHDKTETALMKTSCSAVGIHHLLLLSCEPDVSHMS